MTDASFYRAFEDLHRGSRELIQSRQSVYLPFVLPLAQLHPDAPVTDIGCGRGEWLELLRRHGVKAQGVDLDEGMLAACHELGLQAVRADALQFLRSLPDASQAGVTAFHVAEHLGWGVLEEVVAESLRVLRPGGLLILETPNPENIAVGTSGFYMDPTHEKPLPPALLSFLPKHAGFAQVATLRLNAARSYDDGEPVTLMDVLAGVSPDYAVVAQKSAAALSHPALAQISDVMAAPMGVQLGDVAARYDLHVGDRLHRAQVTAEEAHRAQMTAEEAHRAAVSVADALSADSRRHREQTAQLRSHTVLLNERLETVAVELHALQRALGESQAQLQAQLHAMHAIHTSTSWRVTGPLRWAGGQVIALRQQGPAERIRRFVRRMLGRPALAPSPVAAEPEAPADYPMTGQGRQIAEALQRAIDNPSPDRNP